MVLWRLIVVKVPTAYMVLPHWAICRICSVVLVLAGKWGVEVTGAAWTGPGGVTAWLAGVYPASPKAAAAAMLVVAASLQDLRYNEPPNEIRCHVLRRLTAGMLTETVLHCR